MDNSDRETLSVPAGDQRAENAEPRHTPRPWEWRNNDLVAVGERQTLFKATAWNWAPGDKSLIAAAPDLLAVAKRMVADADALAQSFGLDRISETDDSLIADARAAISKATGAAS